MKDHDSDNIVKIDSAHDEKVVAIDFYRLTDTIDINQKVIINNYRLVFPYPFLSTALVSMSLNSYTYKVNHNDRKSTSAFDFTPGMQKVFFRADCNTR